MKKVMHTMKKTSLYLGIFALTLGVSSCSDDDDGTVNIPDTDASITANAQVISQNVIFIDEVIIDDDAWLVARKVNEDGSFSEIISDPVLLQDGTHSDITITLNNTDATDVVLEDGDSIILMLHKDDGDGVFEFEGNSGADSLITDANGSGINAQVEVSAPSITWADQEVMENGILFDNISTNQNGWIVLHNADGEGAFSDEMVGWAYVPAGDNPNVTVNFNEGFVYTPGQNLYSRLYIDNPADEAFTFGDDATTDIPESFGFGTDNTVTGNISLMDGAVE